MREHHLTAKVVSACRPRCPAPLLHRLHAVLRDAMVADVARRVTPPVLGGSDVSLVLSGLTTKESIKGQKHGAKRMSICQRIECCTGIPSEIHPRRLVPRNAHAAIVSGGGQFGGPPGLAYSQL